MMMIQDGPMPTGADKPLRISGDPYKVQVHKHLHTFIFVLCTIFMRTFIGVIHYPAPLSHLNHHY